VQRGTFVPFEAQDATPVGDDRANAAVLGTDP
jgi:hypothetical protein